jgi:hypothetical protein
LTPSVEAKGGTVPIHQGRAHDTAKEVARTVLYLASDESAHLSGVELVMDRGHTG